MTFRVSAQRELSSYWTVILTESSFGSDSILDSDSFKDAAITPSAHEAALKAAESIAAVGLKVLVDAGFRKSVREQWQARMNEVDGQGVMKMIDEVLPKTEGPVKGLFCSCGHGQE